MSPALKYAYQPFKWIFVIPFVFLTTMFLSLCAIITGLISSPDTVDYVAKLWAKVCCGVVPLKIRLKGGRNYDKRKAYVVVANHQSMADIPAIHARLGLNIKWVMKQELRKVPLFGFACHQLGCIYVDRSNHDAAIRSIREAQMRMSATACPFFFAEGTRTRDGSLLPFKKGAFNFALDTGLPILPVTIRNSYKILPSDSLDLIPGTIELVAHPPVNTTDYTREQIDELVNRTRDLINSAL